MGSWHESLVVIDGHRCLLGEALTTCNGLVSLEKLSPEVEHPIHVIVDRIVLRAGWVLADALWWGDPHVDM